MAHTGEPGADPALAPTRLADTTPQEREEWADAARWQDRPIDIGIRICRLIDHLEGLEMKCSELRNDKAFLVGALEEIYHTTHDPAVEILAQDAINQHEGEQDGMARLQHDVVTLPADQQALGLVEAILEAAKYIKAGDDWAALVRKLITIQGDAERLKVLLERQSALEKRRDQFEQELRS